MNNEVLKECTREGDGFLEYIIDAISNKYSGSLCTCAERQHTLAASCGSYLLPLSHIQLSAYDIKPNTKHKN